MVLAGLLVKGNERFGFGVVGFDAVFHNLLSGVIGTAFNGGPVGDALVDEGVRNHERYTGGYAFAGFSQHAVQRLCLGNGAREAVQQEAIDPFGAAEFGLDHAFHNLIRDQVARIDQGFGLLPKLCAGSNFTAQNSVNYFAAAVKKPQEITEEPVITTTLPAVTTEAPVTTLPAAETTYTTAAETTAPVSCLPGDVDLSGEVDVSDAVLLAQFAVGDKGANVREQGLVNADVTHDSRADMQDVLLIVRYIAGFIGELT